MENWIRTSITRGGRDTRRPCTSLLKATALGVLLACNPAFAVPDATASAAFDRQSASSEVRHVASWVSDSGDNGRMPYLIVDKVNAKVFAFDASGNFRGAEPILLGMAVGDTTVKGIGQQTLASIREQDRTTPAGRFVAFLSLDLHGKQVLMIDYAASLALHPVVKGKPAERRAERLGSTTSKDNRISYGCINVPPMFFEKIVSPAFTNTNGLVYILPEISKASELFGSYDLTAGVQQRGVSAR